MSIFTTLRHFFIEYSAIMEQARTGRRRTSPTNEGQIKSHRKRF
ncbi:hypothetical protein L598_000100001160 [Mesorhizobium sp. J18]|nr:hypothetical protein [Mesorhizobium sp. J18]TWH01135.1 hypothetical protein L598_000100001160 [Mesorhizobium sp. J18]